MPVAEALASGHSLALSPAILANLVRCLAETTLNKIDPQQNGPLWVFQLWLQVYFSTLRPEVSDLQSTVVFGLQLASRPVPLTKPKKSLNTSSAWMSFPMTNF
ncbi:hypothetical protein ACFX2I_029261 [Malus domestica]